MPGDEESPTRSAAAKPPKLRHPRRDALKQNDKSVVMYKLDGADHGGSPFWTEDVLKIVDDFFRKYH